MRSQATVLSASLYPSHFDLASQSFEAFLDQGESGLFCSSCCPFGESLQLSDSPLLPYVADSSERTRSISFLIHVHSYFPRWRVLNWSVVWNLLFEEEFNIEQHSKASGGGRQSTYEMDNLPDDPATAMVEAEHLRVSLLRLSAAELPLIVRWSRSSSSTSSFSGSATGSRSTYSPFSKSSTTSSRRSGSSTARSFLSRTD